MIGFLRQQSWANRIFLLVALSCLIAPAIQYPLSTTFPIGGDAAAHITTVEHMSSRPFSTIYRITQSWYPATYLLFSMNAFIPFVSWVALYPWWMALGQILTGLAIGFLLFRLSGIRAAAIGIALWGMTPIALTSFFEDATMAQLWSLPYLALFFERMAARSTKGMVFYFFLSLLAHPITGLILLATIIITAPQLWIGNPHDTAGERLLRKIYSYSALVATLFAICILASRHSVFSLAFRPESSQYLPELFHGFFLPWTVASIYGWYLMIYAHKERLVLITSFASFFFISILVAANNQLRIGFWTNRLNVYVTICIIIGASVGFDRMLDALRRTWIQVLFASALLIALTGSVFHDNQNIYRRYESPSTYTRIHPDELAAIGWIKEHTPPSAHVLTSLATRHYEWIPVLSGLWWDNALPGQLEAIEKNIYAPYTLLVYFTKTEKVPEHIRARTEHYHLEYENKGAAIFHITPL